jgi:hypothetical protein
MTAEKYPVHFSLFYIDAVLDIHFFSREFQVNKYFLEIVTAAGANFI